jgi:hypothetical protein
MTNEEREAYVAKQPIAVRVISMIVSAVIVLGTWALFYDWVMSKISHPISVVYQVTEPVRMKTPGQLAAEAQVERWMLERNTARLESDANR